MFLRKLLERHSRPVVFATDCQRSNSAAMHDLRDADRQITALSLINRTESSHLQL